MKGIDIFCASQASTAICLSMEQASCSSSSTIQLGGRAIDRHNPIIRDARRSGRGLSTPCSSELPINPKPFHQHQKTKKSSSSKQTDQNKNSSSSKQKDQNKNSSSSKQKDQNKKSSTKPSDQKKKGVATTTDCIINKNSSQPTDAIRKIGTKESDFITPPGSSRYLLSDAAYFDGLSDYDPVMSLVPVEEKTNQTVSQDESTASKPSSSSPSKSSPANQVVVLRVSLHCKGCAGKVKKHLSRMEGVTSFNIDFAAKKVTIIGDVTPLGVLASVSKVKNAQFWPSAVTSTSTPSHGSGNVEIKK